MTILKTTPLVRIGALRTNNSCIIVYKHVYCIPVWRNGAIAWYDQYTTKNGLYLGKTKTLEYLESAGKVKV